MIKNLRESNVNLSALVDQVSKGDEVIITVHGVPKARLCPVEPKLDDEQKQEWVARVQEDWDEYTTRVEDSSQEILNEGRGERNRS